MTFTSWIRQLRSGFSGRAAGRRKHSRAKASRGLAHKGRYQPRVEFLEVRALLATTILNGAGLGYAGDPNGSDPPDTCGAAGPKSYIEVTNANIQIYTPKATGSNPVITDNMSHFFYTVGGLTAIGGGTNDSTMFFDNLMGGDGRFLVEDLDANLGMNSSQIVLAISKSNNPTTLTTADWNFYHVTTTQTSGPNLTDYPGNPGFNADAVVFTFNLAHSPGCNGACLTGDSEFLSINASDLANGVPQASLRTYQNFISGNNSYRPVTMHDSVPGDPMWLVRNPGSGNSIDVIKMTNELSTSASFATTSLSLPGSFNFSGLSISPANPDGSTMTNFIDDRILKAGEYNNIIAATHHVQLSGNELAVQWYAIDVSSGTPAFQQVGGVDNIGRIHYGSNTYAFMPGIDINSGGQIGLSFIESDRNGGSADATTGGFVSMFVAARKATDAAGTMEGNILVSAGKGTGNITDRVGDFSGMNVDPVNGTFWGVNEFGSGGPGTTAIANFTAALSLDNTDENITIRVNPLDSTMNQVLVTGTNTVVDTFANNSSNLYVVAGDANNNAVTIDESFGVVNTPVAFYGGGSPGAPGDRMIVLGTSGDDTLDLTPSGPTSADMTFDGSRTYSFFNIQQFSFNGEDGNDSMTLDSTGSLLGLPGGVNYDGGTGFNQLQLVQTGGSFRFNDTYSVGPNPGEGVDTIDGQSVFFQNLAPVQDNVPAGTATVNATPAANAINYSQGPGGGIFTGNTGLVTIDNQESYEFNKKTNLVINGGAGSDEINLNNSTKPAGLISVAVGAGDPTASDSLIVNGTAATVSVVESFAQITGAGPVPITYSAVEALTVVSGASTNLAVSGSSNYTVNPGADISSGTIISDAVYPITFHGFISGDTVSLNGSVAGTNLIVNGTPANDRFTLDSGTGNISLSAPDGSQNRATIVTSSIGSLTLNGLDGDDVFNVTGPQPYANITLSGGDPSASDVANLTGNGTDVALNLGSATASVSGGGLGSISLPGVEIVNLNAGVGNININGTNGPNPFSASPTGANTATVQVTGLAPVVNTTNSGLLTFVDGFVADGDTLTVNGTSASETIGVTTSAVTVGGLKAINYSAANIESLSVLGNDGSDTFNVASGTVPIFIDGGNPIGVTPGDLLNIVTNPGDTVTFTPGPSSDSGGFVVNSNQPISFVHIESLSVSGGGTPVINGTNGNDVITVIARDSSYAAGADGVQDFTVSVNAGPTFLFLNVPSLAIHALGGNDLVDLVTPAPNGADWNVNVTIDGGPPSALPGDNLTLETPGFNAVTYTPSSSNSGMVVIKGAVNDTNVAIMDIEQFTYNGMGGNDAFTMVGNSSANVFTLTPGANNDAGTLAMDSTLPVAFQNLGPTGKVIINGNGGADSLVYYGTAANDTFIIDNNASPAGGKITVNARVPVISTGVATLTLEGLDGDDTFTLVPTITKSPYTTLNLHGGAQASATGDQANLTATASMDINVSGQVVSQGGVTVAGSGLENINLNGASNRLIYNGVAGVTENINVMASPTANQGLLSVPGVTQVTFVNVPAFVVNGNPADSDTLTFSGTNNNDTFNINLAAAGTANDPVLQLQSSGSSTLLLSLQNYTGFTTLDVKGLDGSDTFNVFTGPSAPPDPNLPGGRNLFVDGTLPGGKKKGTDVLHVFYVSPRPKIVQTVATQNHTSGQISLDYGTANYLVGYAGIENVTISKK
jgi:hypothetical protein